jgi:hypothetical protein
MNTEQRANLLFLLSLPLVGAGCPGDDATAETGAGASASTTAGDTNAVGDTTGGPAATTTGGGSSGEGSTGAPSTGGTTTGDTTDGSTGAAATTGVEFMCDGEIFPYDVGPLSDGCIAYAETINECFEGGMLSPECVEFEAAVCQQIVNFDVMNAGPACATAYDDLYVCLSRLSFRDFMAPDPCPPEVAAWMQACFGA